MLSLLRLRSETRFQRKSERIRWIRFDLVAPLDPELPVVLEGLAALEVLEVLVCGRSLASDYSRVTSS